MASTSASSGPQDAQRSAKKPLTLEKKLAAGVCLAFGLSLMITARTTKFLYKRLQEPVELTHAPKIRLRDLKKPGASFQFLSNRTLLEHPAGQEQRQARPSLRGMVDFVANGWREEDKPPKPEEFNPALDATKALGVATAAVFGFFGAASGAVLWWWGVTDLESFKLAMRSEMPNVLQVFKPDTVPEWARLPKKTSGDHVQDQQSSP